MLLRLFFISASVCLLASCQSEQRQNQSNKSTNLNTFTEVRPLEGVAALGQLSPLGEVRSLAAPVSGFGGTPRISKLLVSEGDLVIENQILAVFDNRPQILADYEGSIVRLNTLDKKIAYKKREISRYEKAASQGAAPLIILEQKQHELTKFQGDKNEVLAVIRGLKADLLDSQLKSPIDGVVLRVFARKGERPGSDGVVEVGANQEMEALIEVYESDINRINLGQDVYLTSENGGFIGTLKGSVRRISPQVRQRKVLSTDPTGDSDARIVEVRVTLDPESSSLVNHLTGMKVIARFKPK